MITPTASATRPPTAVPTATPATAPATVAPPARATPDQLLAVAAATFPKGQNGYGSCVKSGAAAADWSGCPFTPRLRARMEQNPLSSADPLCRCQNLSLDYAVTVNVTGTGGVAHVVLFTGSVHVDLVVILLSGARLVDDTECTGGGQPTSIYGPSPPACP